MSEKAVTNKVKILYIGGYSRSGSTLLLRLLDKQPGFVAVGELFDVWERSYSQNQLCGCGSGFHDCEFWAQVTVEAFGCKPGDLPAEQFNRLRYQVQGYRQIPALWLNWLRSADYQRKLHDYTTILNRLYMAVRRISSADVIVDSSKVPQYAWMLAETEEIELHMVHLIRDSRGAAFSWQRRRIRPEITAERTYMDKHSMIRSAAEWNAFNYLVQSRRSSYASYTVIKYEDLVTDPHSELRKVMSALGGDPAISMEIGKSLVLESCHTASGNPARFKVGEIGMSLDVEWEHAMRNSHRLLVTAFTAPGLFRYRYPLLLRSYRGD